MLSKCPFFCCHLLTFYKIIIFKKLFWNTIRFPNGLNPDQDRHCVGPDLSTNCLRRLSVWSQQKSPHNQGKKQGAKSRITSRCTYLFQPFTLYKHNNVSSSLHDKLLESQYD